MESAIGSGRLLHMAWLSMHERLPRARKSQHPELSSAVGARRRVTHVAKVGHCRHLGAGLGRGTHQACACTASIKDFHLEPLASDQP